MTLLTSRCVLQLHDPFVIQVMLLDHKCRAKSCCTQSHRQVTEEIPVLRSSRFVFTACWKELIRLSLETLRLLSKKTFNFCLSAEKAGDCSRYHAEAREPERSWLVRRIAYHFSPKWQINKGSSKLSPKVILQQQVCKQSRLSVSQGGTRGPMPQNKTSEVQSQEETA